MKEKFTKGDWSIEPHGDGFALYAGRSGVAHGLNLFNIKEVDKNFEANAALIAAAPEMYEMLKHVLGSPYCVDMTGLPSHEEVNMLLAKARGE